MATKLLLQNLVLCRTLQKALLCCLRQHHLGIGTSGFRNIWSIRELKLRCSYCMLQHQQLIHMSAPLYSRDKWRHKMIKKRKGEVFQVFLRPHMTPAELAKACRTSVETIYECLVISVGRPIYNEPDIEITDTKVIKNVVGQLGLEFTMVDVKKHAGTRKQQAKEKEEKDSPPITDVIRQPPPDPSVLVKRPPVVTIMGHVDHGKTTLLDALRETNVVAQEFGGITQHIGAFSVRLPTGDLITFLDTPGHAAFTAMRARGASVTDIVVLVVAAEDGVMETTLEALQHAKESNVPIIVAINKIDKHQANVEGCKRSLLEHGIAIEDYGGDVQVVPISALKRINLDMLQENIIALSEVMELKGDPVGRVEGHVIESRTDIGRGKLATALIQRGTLRKGALLVAGNTWTKVRKMYNDKGQPIEEAPPSTPVEIIGFKDLPIAGDEILQVDSEKTVRSVLAWRKSQKMVEKMEADNQVIEEKRKEHKKVYNELRTSVYRYSGIQWWKFASTPTDETLPNLAIVVKGDVNGSVEAILDTLATYKSDLCRLDVISHGVGDVNEHDIQMAEAFDGVVFAFNVGVNNVVNQMHHKVPIKQHKVIYKLFDDLLETLNSRLPPLEVEDRIGEADVLQVFKYKQGKKKIPVGGCRCVDGKLEKKMLFEVIRKGEVIYKGPINSLKHHKEEVETIVTGKDCGIALDPNSDIELQVGDQIFCIALRDTEQTIDWAPRF